MRLRKTWTWKDDDGETHEAIVETIHRVADPGETVPATETLDELRTRHLAKVAAAMAKYPPVQG